MQKIIHNLRQKSEETRRHILHITTVVVSIILFFIWVYSLGSGFSEKETQAKIKNDVEPFSALKDNFVNGYKSISDGSSSLIE